MGLLAFFAERRQELWLLTREHVGLAFVATLVAAAVGVPVGITMTRHPRLARPLLGLANIFQTIPSLALFGFLIPLPFVGGIGARTAIVALVLYALLPIVRNTFTGIRQVDPNVLEAATALGMTQGQRLRLVELPLALPVILAGVRIAAVVSVGTATIAAAVGGGGLGTYVFRGIATVDSRLILAGAIPAALMALGVDGLLGLVEKRPRWAPALGGLLIAGIAASFLRSGTPDATTPVVVGSKNFTESVLLGEIAATLLESRGFTVDRRFNLGGTSLCHAALVSGQLDLYYEYTGTALKDVLKQKTLQDRSAVLRAVRDGYRSLGLAVGEPLGFNNTFALVMRRRDADSRGVSRISDLGAHGAALRVGLFGEFLEREDGMKGLLAHYGFRFANAPREMDLGLLYQALANDTVDLVVGSATDGLIEAMDLAVLEDDKGYFPPYDAVPLINSSRAAVHPGLTEALAALSGRIDERAMRRLNHAVDGEHQSPAAVARRFLEDGGLVKRR